MKIKKSKAVYALQKLEDLCSENGYKKVAVTTSLPGNDLSEVLSELDQIADQEHIPVGTHASSKIVLEPNLTPGEDYQSLKNIRACDGVLLIEKLTATTHKRFDELMELLRQNAVNVIGVICL